MSEQRCPECGGTWNASGPEDHAPGCRKAPTMANAYQTLREADAELEEGGHKVRAIQRSREDLTDLVTKLIDQKVSERLAVLEWRVKSLEAHWNVKPDETLAAEAAEMVRAAKPVPIESATLMEGADTAANLPFMHEIERGSIFVQGEGDGKMHEIRPDTVTKEQSEEWLRNSRLNYEKSVGVLRRNPPEGVMLPNLSSMAANDPHSYWGRRTADGAGFAVVKEEAPARRRRKWWRLWLW